MTKLGEAEFVLPASCTSGCNGGVMTAKADFPNIYPGDRNLSGALMKTIKLLIIVALIGVFGIAAFIYSGIFNIAADNPHWPVTFKILTTVRDRSVKARSGSTDTTRFEQ